MNDFPIAMAKLIGRITLTSQQKNITHKNFLALHNPNTRKASPLYAAFESEETSELHNIFRFITHLNIGFNNTAKIEIDTIPAMLQS